MAVLQQMFLGIAPSGAWLPQADGVDATIFADFKTEGSTNHYYAAGATRASAAAWLTALSGTFTRASSAYRTKSDGTLESVSSNVLRFNHSAAGSLIGFLMEGARTNLQVRSQEFATSPWTLINATITADDTTAPDGTTTADRFNISAGGGVDHTVYTNAAQSNVQHSASVYVKAGTGRYITLSIASGAGGYGATFDLQNGVITQGTGMTRFIRALPNGWYRLEITAIIDANYLLISYSDVATFTPDGYGRNGSATAAGTETFYLWGAQLEASAGCASSYIPTTSGTATRAADALNWASTQSVGAVITETEALGDQGNDYIVGQNASNGAPLYKGLNFIGTWTGSLDLTKTLASGDWSTVRRAGVSGNGSGRKLTVGGQTPASDANALIPSAPSSWSLGSNGGGSSPLYGNIRSLTIFAAPISDSALQSLTT